MISILKSYIWQKRDLNLLNYTSHIFIYLENANFSNSDYTLSILCVITEGLVFLKQ